MLSSAQAQSRAGAAVGGRVVTKSEAIRWYRKPAEQGHVDAQFSLGWCYQYGIEGSVNQDEAARWYGYAADQGHPTAGHMLASLNNELSNNTPSGLKSADKNNKIPIYYAADRPPVENIPPEAPLCYKFMVSSIEDQLRRLSKKYPSLYGDEILINSDGSKTLVAKRKDASGRIIDYFYSTSPAACNKNQRSRLQK